MKEREGEGQELGIPIEDATLENLCGGELEEQFQADVAKVIEVNSIPGEWQLTGKFIKSRIILEVEFLHHVESGANIASVSSQFRGPKRKKIAASVFVKDGVLLTEAIKQLTLEDASNVVELEAKENGLE